MESKSQLRGRVLNLLVVWFFLVALAIEDSYGWMKEGFVNGQTASAWLYIVEITGLLVFSVALGKFFHNIYRQKFFISQNVWCFDTMGYMLLLPCLTNAFHRWFDLGPVWTSLGAYERIGFGLFLILLGQVFRYGQQLKEEQDLTV